MPSVNLLRALFILIFVLLAQIPSVCAAEGWEKVDKRLKNEVCQINVAIKGRLKDSSYVQLSDLSPKYHLPVFSTLHEDKGFRVVGFGTAFPIRTIKTDKTYFLTNRHVVDTGDGLLKECQRFFAAVRLCAEQSQGIEAEKRYKELLAIINLAQKKELNMAERSLYQTTVDSVWDTYENQLSVKADPQRNAFQKYLALSGLKTEIGYFLHFPGPVTQQALEVQMYKMAKEDDQDLAILSSNNTNLEKMEFDGIAPTEGQEIQVIGYPAASEQIDLDSSKYYSPTFSTGRISRIAPHLLQVDAPVTRGNSGGPVISQRAKVLGVVVRRAVSTQNVNGVLVESELPSFGGAITIQSIKSFAPELFGGK